MSYIPPTGTLTLDLASGYSPPTGSVTLSLDAGDKIIQADGFDAGAISPAVIRTLNTLLASSIASEELLSPVTAVASYVAGVGWVETQEAVPDILAYVVTFVQPFSLDDGAVSGVYMRHKLTPDDDIRVALAKLDFIVKDDNTDVTVLTRIAERAIYTAPRDIYVLMREHPDVVMEGQQDVVV